MVKMKPLILHSVENYLAQYYKAGEGQCLNLMELGRSLLTLTENGETKQYHHKPKLIFID
jgi:hypothetical protein